MEAKHPIHTLTFAERLNNAWSATINASTHAEYKAYLTEYRQLLYSYRVADKFCYPIEEQGGHNVTSIYGSKTSDSHTHVRGAS